MTTDSSAVAYQLKRVYGDKITDLFTRQTQAYNHFMASSRKSQYRPGGVGYYFAVRQGDIESIGGRAEGAYIPEPLSDAGAQGVITPKMIYGSLRLSGLAIEAGKSSIEAFAEVQGDKIANLYKSMIVDLNRQCWGDGYGLLGTLSAASDALSTSATWTATFNNDTGIRYIRKGMIVDFYQSTAIDQSSVTSRVASLTPGSKAIELEAVAAAGSGGSAYQAYHPIAAARTYTIATDTVASGSFMVRYGARAATHATTNASYELTGLLGHFDDGTLIATHEGLLYTTYPEWKANILSNSSVNRELTIDLMLAATDMSSARCGKPISTMYMGLGQRRKYFALLANDIRYATANFVGGYESLKFSQNGAIDMIVDPSCQANRIFCEAGQAIKKYELTPIGWGGFDAEKMHWREMYDEGTMFLRIYTNLGVEERTALTLISDLIEPSNMPF